MQKTVRIIRGGQPYPLVMDNGDKYDSVAILTDEKGQILYIDPLVNTDFTVGYKGGIIAEGTYYAIAGTHKGKYRSLKLFTLLEGQKLSDIKSEDNLTLKNRTFPSLIPNPNHNNRKSITLVSDHGGGWDNYDMNGKLINTSWDFSNGCMSRPSWTYGKWISHFQPGEIVRYIIERSPLWILPEGV
jgi:hypothetical protein